ncbi:MAG: MFS transporter [Acidocella sp.]|nr:MFS transporter [Acidocella sp.]
MSATTIKNAAGVAASVSRTRARFGVLALIAIITMVNYLDRSVLGLAAPTMAKDLGLAAGSLGVVFSAFAWTYTASQIPGGVFLDRFGSKLTYGLSLILWSAITLLQTFVGGMGSLLACRFGLGVAEAPCFPTNSRIVGTWFPQSERARATSVYTVGEYVGLAFLSPVLLWIMHGWSWHALFVVVGAFGILLGFAWFVAYRNPEDSNWANQAELDYIEAGGGLAPVQTAATPFAWSNVFKLLRYRQVWGASIGQFAGNATLVFFLTWFPTYLVQARGMGWVKEGFFLVLPFIAAAIGVMAGGFFSDKLLKWTGSANISRKTPIIVGLLLASTIILANYVNGDALVVAILSLAFFGQGMVGLGWTVISDIAPKNLMGLTGGIFNGMTNLSGIITPLAIGYILAATGSFNGALIFIAAIAMTGALSYIFLLGDVKRIELD